MNAKIFTIVVNANKGSFASLKTLTKVNIPQKLGLGKNVIKYTEKVVQIGANYQSAVNRHYDNEGIDGTFTAEKLPWGEWLVVDKVISHKGKTYYRFYDIDGGVKVQTYFVDGIQATQEQIEVIKAYQSAKGKSSRQECEKKVRPTNVEESNILYLSCGGTYVSEVEVATTAQAK